MRKRTIAILVAAGLLALGLTVGVVMAQDGGTSTTATPTPAPTPTTEEATTFADRLAAILDLESATVQEAFAEARRDQEDEAYKSRLDQIVEAGKLTQEEADARYTWFQDRPDSIVRKYGEGKRGRHSFNRGRFGGRGDGWDGPRRGRHGRFGGAKGQMTPAGPTPTPSGESS